MCIKWAVTYICWTLTHSTWIATYYWWASTFVLGHPRIYLDAHKFSWLSTYLIGHPCWRVDNHIHTWVPTHKPGCPHIDVVAHILVWTPTYTSGKPRIQMGVHICCMDTHSGLWSRLDAICDSPSMPTRLQNWAEKPRSIWASTRVHDEVCAPSRRFARKTRLATPAKFGKPHAFCLEVHRWPRVQVDAHTSVGTCEHIHTSMGASATCHVRTCYVDWLPRETGGIRHAMWTRVYACASVSVCRCEQASACDAYVGTSTLRAWCAMCVCWVRVGEHDASRLVGARWDGNKKSPPHRGEDCGGGGAI